MRHLINQFVNASVLSGLMTVGASSAQNLQDKPNAGANTSTPAEEIWEPPVVPRTAESNKLDRLAVSQLISAEIETNIEALASFSTKLANAVKEGTAPAGLCSMFPRESSSNIPTAWMLKYIQSVQDEVDNGGQTPENRDVRVALIQEKVDAIEANNKAVIKKCFSEYDL